MDSPEEWMSNLPDELQNIALTKLAIPGSHNSGAYNLAPVLAPDAPGFLKTMSKLPGSDRFKTTLKRWCECQRLSIKDQLNLGIRYLDLRISTDPQFEDFFLVHALYGPNCAKSMKDTRYDFALRLQEFYVGMTSYYFQILDALGEVKEFLDNHTREVVIIDVNHFYQMNSEHHQQLIRILRYLFDTKLLTRTSLSSVSLKSMNENQKQVICIYHHEEGVKDEFMWTKECISSPWPNTKSPDVCISKLTDYMQRFTDLSLDIFSVCQGILTPDAKYAVRHMGKGGVYKMTQQLLPQLLSWLQSSPSNWTYLPNIVIHDFVEENNYIQYVLELNKYRTTGSMSEQQLSRSISFKEKGSSSLLGSQRSGETHQGSSKSRRLSGESHPSHKS